MRGVLIVVYLAVVVAVLFVAAVVATSEDPVLADAPPDAADVVLPAGQVQPEDVADLRFGLALRGYRMSEVDPVLDRLATELRGRDQRIAELEGALVALAEPQVSSLEQGGPPSWGDRPLSPPPAEPQTVATSEPTSPPPLPEPAPTLDPEVEPLRTASPERLEPAAREPQPPSPATQPDLAPPEPQVTDLVAPDPTAVHAPVETVDDDFPEVLLPEPAAEGTVEAREDDAPVFPEPVALPPHEPLAHTAPAPDWGWPGEGAAPASDETPGGDRPPSP